MSSDEDIDYSEIQSALESIGLSAVLIFGATLVGQGFGMLTRISMARYLPVDGYGNIAIGLSVLNLFGLAALAGMPVALSRYLPRQETDEERQDVLLSTLQIVGVLSVILAIGIYLVAKPVAMIVFRNDNLVWIIRIFAGVLPFYALFKLSLGGFRGYEKTLPRILTQNILRPGLQLAMIVIFVVVGYSTSEIAFGYATAFAIVAIIALSLLFRISKISTHDIKRNRPTSQYREILAFSIPLAASDAISVIAKHSDIILLGIFSSSSEVGTYEVAFRIAVFAYLLFQLSFGYLFNPIMSRFDTESNRNKMEKLYTMGTRWVVVASFPVFVLFFLFAEQSLVFFFGRNYGEGSLALQILLVGFIISLLPGLTSNFLLAVGRTKLILYISVGALVLNIVLNVILIPAYGIVGAAMATATARMSYNIAQMYFIYNEFNFHPFNREYIVPTGLMGAIFGFIYITPIPFANMSFFQGFVVAVGFGILYFIILFLTRSIYSVELHLIDEFLTWIGIPVSVSERLQQFVR